MVGASFRGLYGIRKTVLDKAGKEREITVDDAYLIRAIQDPAAETAKGYPPIMPRNELPESDLRQVVEYIKALK